MCVIGCILNIVDIVSLMLLKLFQSQQSFLVLLLLESFEGTMRRLETYCEGLWVQ